MEKIPTLFKRDPENMRRVLPEVTPGCEWVLAGEGAATRKFDGTCVMLEPNGLWWARREVKPGKEAPPYFAPISTDPNTGKTVGWEPIAYSGFAKWHAEAVARQSGSISGDYAPGTYELCGPKVNGNPEGYDKHTLIWHADAMEFPIAKSDLTFEGLRALLIELADMRIAPEAKGIEGIVWHHPDGRMAKLKGRDFERATGTRNEAEAVDVA